MTCSHSSVRRLSFSTMRSTRLSGTAATPSLLYGYRMLTVVSCVRCGAGGSMASRRHRSHIAALSICRALLHWIAGGTYLASIDRLGKPQQREATVPNRAEDGRACGARVAAAAPCTVSCPVGVQSAAQIGAAC